MAVSEILKTIIGCYKEIFKVQALSDTALLQNFAQTALVIDEVCKEVSQVKRLEKAVCGENYH